jgi:hypothetical protein
MAALASALCASREGRAQVNDNCNQAWNGSPCIDAQNSSGSPAASSVYALNKSSNMPTIYVEQDGTDLAVYAYNSSTGEAIEGIATSGNAILGTTGSSTNAGVWAVNTGLGRALHAQLDPTGAGTAVWGDNATGSSTGWAGYFAGNVNITYNLDMNGTCYAGPCTSDVRLKKNIEPLRNSLEDIARLRPVSFEWREPSDHAPPGMHVGFIAQEAEKVKPGWVGVDANGFKTLNTLELPVILADAVRTLKMENDELGQRVKSLEAGRRPMISGVGEGSIGFGLVALAGALVITRRRRSDSAG